MEEVGGGAPGRKAAFADPPSRPNEVWQLDFSEYETTTGGIWRLAGVTDCFSKYEHGWHISPTSTGADAIVAVEIAIAEAERLGGARLVALLPAHPDGTPARISRMEALRAFAASTTGRASSAWAEPYRRWCLAGARSAHFAPKIGHAPGRIGGMEPGKAA